METYLRMMFLKLRYRLGYESLCREVTDSITWRRFCRIPLDRPVPHPTTLMKLTTRCGPTAVDGLNEALLAKAAEGKGRVPPGSGPTPRWCPANVAYPTDSGLLAKAVRRITTTGRRIQAAGGATRTKVRDRSRAAGRRAHDRCEAEDPLGGRPGPGPGGRARRTLNWPTWPRPPRSRRRGCWPTRNVRCAGPGSRRTRWSSGDRDSAAGRRRRLARAVADLTELLEATRRIAAQTRQRLAGITPDGPTRRVSLHDPDARPIAKGRLGRPVEFGHKAQVFDNDDGIVLDHTVGAGQSARCAATGPRRSSGWAQRTGRTPRAVHRGPWLRRSRVWTSQPLDSGSATVVIPRKGRPRKARRAEEHRPAFRRIVKWRTGSEGRISALKRGYGWDRSRIDGTEGTRIWTGVGVFAHNLIKISALAG